MLMPKKTKYRKQQTGKMRGVASRGNMLNFGDFGLQAAECGWLTTRQIEAARIAMTRFIKRTGRIWIRIFPDKPITKKPAETRMGKGKGPPKIGWQSSGQAESSTRWKGFLKKGPRRPFFWPLINCLSARSSS